MRLGIIGTGRIAKRAVMEIAEVPNIEITAVFNPNSGHGLEFAAYISEKLKRKRTLATNTMTEFLENIDAVYIASPHGTHYEYALQMLKVGKHVLCEKPMCFSESQAMELFMIAEKKKLVLIEALKTEFCPGFNKVESVVKSGIIGDVIDVEATFTRLTAEGGREYDDLSYGGAFTEFGTYCMLPIFRFLGIGYDEVSFLSIPAETGVDGYTKVIFTYIQNGSINKLAQAKTGLTVKSEGQLLISGTKGYIIVPSPWWLTRYFEVRYENPKVIDRYECEFLGDGLRYEFEEFKKRVSWQEINENQKSESITRAGVYEQFLCNRVKI